jgi:hypothetical protein
MCPLPALSLSLVKDESDEYGTHSGGPILDPSNGLKIDSYRWQLHPNCSLVSAAAS